MAINSFALRSYEKLRIGAIGEKEEHTVTHVGTVLPNTRLGVISCRRGRRSYVQGQRLLLIRVHPRYTAHVKFTVVLMA